MELDNHVMNTAMATNSFVIPESADLVMKLRTFGVHYEPIGAQIVMIENLPRYVFSNAKPFTSKDLFKLEDDETVSDEIKNYIKRRYLTLCSFAFMFQIGNECVIDENNRLIPINLSYKNQLTIFQNDNGIYPPYLVTEITNSVYKSLDVLEESKNITFEQKNDIIEKYQNQLDFDDLILDEVDFGTVLEKCKNVTFAQKINIIKKYQNQVNFDDLPENVEIGTCCWCLGECKPESQTCGRCIRF
jgi:hypothetical protein